MQTYVFFIVQTKKACDINSFQQSSFFNSDLKVRTKNWETNMIQGIKIFIFVYLGYCNCFPY
jgi:hypothetical protein